MAFAASLSLEGVKFTSTRSSRPDAAFAVSIIPGRDEAIFRNRAYKRLTQAVKADAE